MESKKTFQNILLFLHKPFLYFIECKNNCYNLPERYILACNHPNYTDGFFVYLYWYWNFNKKVSMFAHEKYFNKWFTKPFLSLAECIKVSYSNPGDSLINAYKEKNKNFCLFIEGKKTNKKITPKTGCVRLSKYHKIPIIPIKIINKGKFKRKIIIGKPFIPASKDIKKESLKLLNIIYKLR